MKKDSKARIIVLSTLAGLTVVFLGAAVIAFQNATKAHENSQFMKMTRNYETQPPIMTEVVLPMPTDSTPIEIDLPNDIVEPTVTAAMNLENTAVSTNTPSPTNTPQPTLSPWEQVQKQVEQLRSRLERGSEGYVGLSAALEESEPNETWCNNLLIAIQDFNYVNDTASSGTVQALADAQNCPK